MPEQEDQEFARFKELEGLYSTFHQNVRTNEDFYNLKFRQRVVPAAQRDKLAELMPLTARRAIDEAVDHILFTPRILVPRRPSQRDHVRAQSVAEKKRHWLNSWWSNVGLKYNAVGDGRKPLLNFGMVAMKVTLRWDLIPDLEDFSDRSAYRRALDRLGEREFLWDVELLDPRNVFVDPSDHRNPRYAYVHYEIFREDAKEIFPDSEKEWTRGGMYDTVEYTEYWSWDPVEEEGRYIQWINGEREHEGDNVHLRIPIAVEDSGYGYVTRLARPEDRFVGMTQFMHDVFIAEARQMTAMQAVAEFTAFPGVKRRNFDPAEPLLVGPGEVWDLRGNPATDDDAQDIEFTPWPPIPITIPQLLDMTARMANSTLKMDLLGGIPVRGQETATEITQSTQNAAAKLTAPVAALERLIRRISQWALQDVEKVLEAPVTLFATSSDGDASVRVGPQDISGFYDVRVELKTTDREAIEMQVARFWLDAARLSPFLSYTTALERGGVVDDPQDELVRRAAEDVVVSPQFQMMRIVQGATALQQFNQLVQAQVAQETGAVEGGGAPNQAPSDEVVGRRDQATAAAQDQRDVVQSQAQNVF